MGRIKQKTSRWFLDKQVGTLEDGSIPVGGRCHNMGLAALLAPSTDTETSPYHV